MRKVIRGLGAIGVFAVAWSVMLSAAAAPVADAAMKRDAAAVRALLRDGADVNAAQGDGMAALHWAARNGDAELTQVLLFAGANVKASTRLGGYTPLLMAAQHGHAAVIAALLTSGADAKAANSLGTTALMLAAASGNPAAVTTLVENGAEIEAREKTFGQTPLMFAVTSNRVAAVKALIKAGADVKATSKVVNVGSLSSQEQEFLAQASGSGAQPGGGGQGRAGQVVAPGDRRGGGGTAGIERPYFYNELIGTQGGHTALILAARGGYTDAAETLVAAGADVNQVSAGDKTSAMLIATINGQFDLAQWLLEQGANPNAAAANGVTPLYAALNVTWAPRALYPQPRAFNQQQHTYLAFMKALLEKGADPNRRLTRKVWYSEYNFDLAGVDEIGATPMWRAAFAGDVAAMSLLMEHGADPNIPTMRPAGRQRLGDATEVRQAADVSSLPPVPLGGPGVPVLQAASGVGFGEGFAANSHIHSPAGFMPGIKYLIEVAGADVNAVDHDGNTALHHAAARGDSEAILYLVSKGADVTKVNREGQTVADMANGPVQRTQPYPETLKLLEKLGSKNNHKCVSC